MRMIDLSSWQGVLSTLAGLALVTLIGVGIRLLLMVTVQQRRERMNRQINERLRTLIAAYKILGGSITGELRVDPAHLRDRLARPETPVDEPLAPDDQSGGGGSGSDRARRIRDAVEGALSDILLLGTEEHVRLAHKVAEELLAGRPVHTHALVVSLRAFIREALDLDPVPTDLELPMQGPARIIAQGGRGRGGGEREEGRGGRGGGSGGAGGGAGAMMAGGGLGAGIGAGLASDHGDDNADAAQTKGP